MPGIVKRLAEHRLIFAVLVFSMLVRLTLVTTPYFVADEANYVNMYFEFLKSGRADIYGELMAKPQGMFAFSAPALQPLLLAAKTLGMPVEVPFRVAALLWGLAAIVCAYALFSEISGSREVAALAALIFGITPNFMLVSSFYYPDSFMLVFALLSFLVVLKRQDWWGAPLGGLLMGAAFYVKLHQAFFVFALVVPYMLLKKRVRWDYLAFCALFCILAAIAIVVPYYPHRMEEFSLLVKMELFARANAGIDAAISNAVANANVNAPLLFIGILCAFYSILLKKEDFRFEISQVAMLFAYLLLFSYVWYSAILFFGLALFAARIFYRCTAPERIAIAALLACAVWLSLAVVGGYATWDKYSWEAQKNLGNYLAGKYPVTFIVSIDNIVPWKFYMEKYMPENSPLLMANARMGILGYKSLAEGWLELGRMNAEYYDEELGHLSPPVGAPYKYIAIENEITEKYSRIAAGYEKTAEFGGKFEVYEKKG